EHLADVLLASGATAPALDDRQLEPLEELGCADQGTRDSQHGDRCQSRNDSDDDRGAHQYREREEDATPPPFDGLASVLTGASCEHEHRIGARAGGVDASMNGVAERAAPAQTGS